MHKLTEALKAHEEVRALGQAARDAVNKLLVDGTAVLSEQGHAGTSGYERTHVRLETLGGTISVVIGRSGDRSGQRLTLQEAVALARWVEAQDLADLLADATAVHSGT